MTTHPHLPATGRRLPISSYRLQLNSQFPLDKATQILPYLKNLGITDVYLSPILQAAPGSTHNYDVVDHTKISAELGGQEAFEAFANAAHALGLGVIVDVVPNHMAVPTPVYHNRPLWSVLKRGNQSPYAQWFDLEVDQPILMPVLGKRIGQVLADQEITLEKRVLPTEPERGQQWLLCYYDHVFPVAEGTEALPLSVLVEKQHYRLAHWQVADEELNYRRFFDVGTLAGIRVERPEVFDATHKLLLELFHQGFIDAFRVDHPDGLANPREYFRRLNEATDGAWIVAEKILEGDEELPSDWAVCGTTGYDALMRVEGLQVNSLGGIELGVMMQQITQDSPGDYQALEAASKEQIANTSLAAELRRITSLAWQICGEDLRLRDFTFRTLLDSLKALVINLGRYRAYVVANEPAPPSSRALLASAKEAAALDLPESHQDALDVLEALVLGDEVGSAGRAVNDQRRDELAIRFQQVCGAVMAKGVEDTFFYRWTHLTSLCEVGGDPSHFGWQVDELHSWCARIQKFWPATQTTLSTHDAKRGEDVRARLAVISQRPRQWRQMIYRLRKETRDLLPADLDGRSQNLTWQTLAGTWTQSGPIEEYRLVQYLTKAVREQKVWTFWTDISQRREDEFLHWARQLRTHPSVVDAFTKWYEDNRAHIAANVLSTKAIQLTVPGVADIYQGEEITQNSLVDPDNRRQVDFDFLQSLLAQASQDLPDPTQDLDGAKLALTSAILKLRQRQSRAFVSDEATYTPLATTTGHAIAFARGDACGPKAITVATVRSACRPDPDSWEGHQVLLPEGNWKDILTGHTFSPGLTDLADLLTDFPVTVLENIA